MVLDTSKSATNHTCNLEVYSLQNIPEGLKIESVEDIMSQPACTDQEAFSVYSEMNSCIDMEELRVDRDRALDLLMKHLFDPCVVRMRETSFNVLVNGSLEEYLFELRELHTTWGTTVPVNTSDDVNIIFSYNGKYVRTDPDG